MKLNYIDGKWIQGNLGSLIVHSPSTGKPLLRFSQAGEDQVDQAVQSAASASVDWAEASLEKREAILRLYATLLQQHEGEVAAVISSETGKPRWEAITEAKTMVGKIELSIQAHRKRCEAFGSGNSSTRFKPHGVMAVFGPFNFPGHLPNGHIVPALLAGNTVVFKPSEMTPSAGRLMVELMIEAGVPAGVINLVQGAKETGVALAQHARIDGLLFTGSAETGDYLRESFAQKPEKMLALELGGNNPLIVWDVKNIEAALLTVIQSAFITAGQRCTCARRLILPDNDWGKSFLIQLAEMTQKIKVGLPDDEPEPFMGPVISDSVAFSLLAAQKKLLESGGIALVWMKHLARKTGLLSPGIMDVTTIGDREDREYFGPLLQVIRVESLDAAIEEANNTSYGLASGILTDSEEIYQQFYQRTRTGIVNWNHPLTGASGAAPFGGVGRSGNFRPSAFFAADYCSYPVASLERSELELPATLPPGLAL